MYEENNITYKVGINWKDVLLKIIMLILFILLLVWLFPKADLDVFYDRIYTENINTMREAAENYYTIDRLPGNVGESSSMTLKEMIDNKMLIRFTDKDEKYCDETSSGVKITKIGENEYVLKVELNCGEQKDYILETIGCNSVCTGSDCIANNNGYFGNIDNTTGSNNNGLANNGSNNSNNGANNNSGNTGSTGNENNNTTVNGDVDEYEEDVKGNIYTTTITYYQHKKAITTTKTVYQCPAGYKVKGTKCTKSMVGATIAATPEYGADRIVVTDAEVTNTGSYVQYVDPIKTVTGTSYSCPSDEYTLNGSYCIKYTNATEVPGETSYTCPEGYTKNNNKCTKTYDATYTAGTTSYTCPDGGKLNGTECTITNNAESEISGYTCPAGYTKNGSTCYKVYDASNTPSTGCPSGYTLNGGKCQKTYDASYKDGQTTYGSWVAQWTRTFSISQSVFERETEKLEFKGASTSGSCYDVPCGNMGLKYTYTYYTRSKNTTAGSYYCPFGGELKNKKCVLTANGTTNNNYSCPNGGTLNGTKCTITTNGTPTYSYTCPTGYEKKDNKCYKIYKATANSTEGSYSCPNGGTLNGTKCTITTNATTVVGETTYTCPEGYSYNKTSKKCELKINANATSIYSYTCPAGYTASGEGEKTKCSKVVQGTVGYYCKDADAKLDGTKCVKTVKGEIFAYTCPSAYVLSGTTCTKKNFVSIDATATTKTTTSYKYKWSKSAKEEGWTFTGKTKVEKQTYNAGQK